MLIRESRSRIESCMIHYYYTGGRAAAGAPRIVVREESFGPGGAAAFAAEEEVGDLGETTSAFAVPSADDAAGTRVSEERQHAATGGTKVFAAKSTNSNTDMRLDPVSKLSMPPMADTSIRRGTINCSSEIEVSGFSKVTLHVRPPTIRGTRR